ncbi:hypothetical protein [Pontibacter fetidus]|uniref:PAP2 superfamily protein n=1 Tax=Pontibacter fetidus TaxID=2700082 RepID=A0A6B2HA43_9BACT|nr:hypothetical protein [Pontibacter fetidus]NDK56462.1 hypothetical protein [Pontibacter fetidus]
MNRSLAKALSVVLHPLLLPTYLFAFILYYLPAPALSLPMQSRWIVLGMIFFTTFIIPGLGAYAMMRSGQLDSMEMERRDQRRLPLLFTSVCYGITTYLLYREAAFDEIFYFIMVIITASVLLTYAVSLFWKVSAHSVGIGGALGLLLLLSKLVADVPMLFPISLSIVLAGAVLSARLALHAHSPAEVYTGFGAGLLLAFTAGILVL